MRRVPRRCPGRRPPRLRDWATVFSFYARRRMCMTKSASKTKYIFVTGGVVSSLGKGVASASIGALLEARGLKVTLVKMDPYINVDPGTMSPFQHGEVFVTDDGAETDLDLGHYERYVSTRTSRRNNFTTGQEIGRASCRERVEGAEV